MIKYLKYFVGIYFNPIRTLITFKGDPKKYYYTILAILTQFIIAGSKQLYYHYSHHPARPVPWLVIPKEKTWLYSFFFLIPTIFIQCIIFAGMTTFFSRLFKGKGTFEGQFACYTMGYIPIIILLISFAFVGFLLKVNDNIIYIIIFWGLLLWDLIVIVISVKIEQEIKIVPSIICGIISSICAFIFSFTYVR